MQPNHKQSQSFLNSLSPEERREYLAAMKIYNASSLDDSFTSLEEFYVEVLNP